MLSNTVGIILLPLFHESFIFDPYLFASFTGETRLKRTVQARSGKVRPGREESQENVAALFLLLRGQRPRHLHRRDGSINAMEVSVVPGVVPPGRRSTMHVHPKRTPRSPRPATISPLHEGKGEQVKHKNNLLMKQMRRTGGMMSTRKMPSPPNHGSDPRGSRGRS